MNILKLSAALMVGGLLVAAPAFAQTTSAKKQPTQEGGPSMPGPTGGNFNADPNYKQRTQEGGPSMPGPVGGNFNADPNYKQRTQSLSHADPSQDAVKQKP
jgi:general stress protein YciG